MTIPISHPDIIGPTSCDLPSGNLIIPPGRDKFEEAEVDIELLSSCDRCGRINCPLDDRGLCNRCKVGQPDPTPEEMEATKAAIRKTWSRKRRAGIETADESRSERGPS